MPRTRADDCSIVNRLTVLSSMILTLSKSQTCTDQRTPVALLEFPGIIDNVPNHPYLAFLFTIWLIHLLHNRYGGNLSSIPGPFVATLTDFWLLIDVARGNSHKRLLQLHRKYNSPFIRIGPRKISVSDPHLVPKIYGFDPVLEKSDFVHIFRTPCNGKFVPSLFNTTDEAYHTRIKKPFANAYSMSTLVEFEEKIDQTTKLFEGHLIRFVETGESFDLPWWLQAYAFDVLGEICFSKRIGFLGSGKDVIGIIEDVKQKLWSGIILIQVRIVGRTIVGLAARIAPTHPIVKFCLKCLNDRKASAEELNEDSSRRKDFLSRCFDAQIRHPDVATDDIIRTVNVDNIMAGSDTTAITLSAIIYHLMLNTSCLAALRAELDRAELSNQVTWKEAKAMPYLQACIKEGLRIHPVVAVPLERVIPRGGLTLSNTHFPAGTIIGCSPYVVARDERLFPDPDMFRPERWLEASDQTLLAMERSSLAWGSGKRVCIGKNVAMLEMSKLIPRLLRRYDFTLAGGIERTSAVKSWFTWIKDFEILVSSRK